MLHRRLLLNQFPELFFYAALSSSKTADYAWDNGTGLAYAGSATISNEQLVSTTAAAQRIRWNCAVPSGKNLTFSAFMGCAKRYGVNCGFCAVHPTEPTYSGVYSGFISSSYYWMITMEVSSGLANSGYIPTTNEKSFYTFSLILNGSNSYTVVFYRNGNKVNTKTFTNTNWTVYSGCYFGYGYSKGSNNVLGGTASKFTCYELLTDDQVLALYNNNGIPL